MWTGLPPHVRRSGDPKFPTKWYQVAAPRVWGVKFLLPFALASQLALAAESKKPLSKS